MRKKDSAGRNGGTAPSGIPDKKWNSVRETLAAFRKRWFLVLACFVLVFAGLCAYHYNKSLNTASAILMLDYEEASRGLTPSQTRFNIFEIQSGEVMEKLIAYAGLEGKITPEEMSECVSVKATHRKNISGSVNYISTSFVVRFTKNSAMDGRSAEGMLSLLCKAYREYFVEHYGYNHSILSFDVSNLKFNDEYLMTADLLELKCSQLEKYVQLRARESKNYQEPETGITFAALEQRVNSLYTYDLARLRSYIIENGIANDRADLNSVLSYKIRMDQLMYDKMMAAYDEDNKGIQMYDAAMSAIVMIPTQDQTMKYYMSRTKTGMDNMAMHADAQLAGATERMEQIAYNRYLTQKMAAGKNDRVKKEKADTMIREAEAALEQLAADIQAADSAYVSKKARNYLTFREEGVGLRERTGFVRSFMLAALLPCAAFAVMFLRNARRERRAEE